MYIVLKEEGRGKRERERERGGGGGGVGGGGWGALGRSGVQVYLEEDKGKSVMVERGVLSRQGGRPKTVRKGKTYYIPAFQATSFL